MICVVVVELPKRVKMSGLAPRRTAFRACAASSIRLARPLAPQPRTMHNRPMALEFTTSYIKDSADTLHYYKKLAERSFEQLPDEMLTAAPDPGSNSIAIIVKHLSGNMRSRWRDFLTTDGEKPDRNRDGEFEAPPKTRAEVLALWDSGWELVFRELDRVTEPDLSRTIYIRGEGHSVMQAIHRQLAHYAYHIGQIVFLAKHFAGRDWK